MTKKLLLTSGDVCLVDDEDYEWLSQYTWSKNKNGRAYTNVKLDGKWTTVWMHRMIMKTPAGLHTDHKNLSKLDNQKSNLRNCTPHQNQGNRGVQKNNHLGVKGVCMSGNKFRAQIRVNGKSIYLGTFDKVEDAEQAYVKASQKYFGEFHYTGVKHGGTGNQLGGERGQVMA